MPLFSTLPHLHRFASRVIGLFAVALLLASCADSNVGRVSNPVSTISVGQPGEVSAMTLASAMLRAGFSSEEILEMGPSIRRSLAESGGAQASRKGEIVALFSYKERKLYVTSGSSGTFVMDAE